MAARIESYLRGVPVLRDADVRYPMSRRGRRFMATHQTPSTDVTGQTSWVVTTPTFMIYQAASASRIILNSIVLSQVGTVAGGFIEMVLAIDTADRFTAATGTDLVPQNVNTASTTAANADANFNPTATAAGAGTRYLDARAAPAQLGTQTILDYGESIIIGATGSILLYTWAAATGPSWFFTFEWTEEDI